jgi:type IV pilus assembly protein PilP
MMHIKLMISQFVALLLLTGCWGEEHGDLREWIASQKAVIKPRVQPLKEPSVFTPQAYTASQGMDPFNMLKLTQVLSRESAQNTSNMTLLLAEKNRRKEELESYPLDSMSMVGSMRKDGQDTALLRVNQLIYQVKTGNYLGQNYGRILQIGEHSIKLREIVQDAAGDWVERMTTLDLQEGSK